MSQDVSANRTRFDLFLVSVLLLFLELACIRWFPAHVLFLTFFTNVVLLACFLGMSVGCLAANVERRWLPLTAPLLAFALAAGHLVERLQAQLDKTIVSVGDQRSPQHVFFGADYEFHDLANFAIPLEVLGGFFFLLLALVFVGPGQELGRAFSRVPERVVFAEGQRVGR
jgi:hypothetical protein